MKTQALVLQAVNAPFVLTVRLYPAMIENALFQSSLIHHAGHRARRLSTERSPREDGRIRNLPHGPLYPKQRFPLCVSLDCRPRRLWDRRWCREGRQASCGGRFGAAFFCVLREMWDLYRRTTRWMRSVARYELWSVLAFRVVLNLC